LLNLATLKKFDSSDIYTIYDDWPSIASKAYQLDLESTHFENIAHIVFCGMGDSGAVGNLLSAILSKAN